MEACLEALLEMDFYTKPPNFGVEAYMEAPAGDALTLHQASATAVAHVRNKLQSTDSVTVRPRAAS
jgi:hypothetical protein